jgi:hypothetical protein
MRLTTADRRASTAAKSATSPETATAVWAVALPAARHSATRVAATVTSPETVARASNATTAVKWAISPRIAPRLSKRSATTASSLATSLLSVIKDNFNPSLYSLYVSLFLGPASDPVALRCRVISFHVLVIIRFFFLGPAPDPVALLRRDINYHVLVIIVFFFSGVIGTLLRR